MVSIIIPYIDEHDYLAEAIGSCRIQRGIEAELIVVCNALTLPEGYEPFRKSSGDIVFIHEPISGSAHARNAGLKAASGEWIQFLDVDDLLQPEKIKHQLEHAYSDAIVSPHVYLYLNGKSENSKWLPEDSWVGILNSGLGSTSSMLWKREALIEIGGWNTSFQSHQEYELLFRLAASGKKITANDHCETIVRQRKHGSITMNSRPVRLREGIRLREEMWRYLKDHNLDTSVRHDAFRQYIFRQLRGLFRQDKKMAMDIYLKYFQGHSFTPKEIHVPGYKLLYRVLGFEGTEKLIQKWLLVRSVFIQNQSS